MADGVRVGRLWNEAERAVVERAAHHRGFLARGHHHHRQVRVQRAHVHQRVETLRTGHVEIHQDQVGVVVLVGQRVQRFHAVGFEQLHARDDPLHRPTQGFAEQRVVIGNQEYGHGRSCHTPFLHQCLHDRGIGQRGDVAQVVDIVLGDLAQDAAHDLAGTRLGQGGRPLQMVGLPGAGCRTLSDPLSA
ncbi:hypothetical protein G6F63_014934 [Rhizopus arrhizus]|nr:hypothetical protein G6F63_014934 [Rhizopus arrhizus]